MSQILRSTRRSVHPSFRKGPLSFMLLATVTVTSPAAVSAPCSDINDDRERMACYESRLQCLGIDSFKERLQCFDGDAGVKADSSVVTTPITVRAAPTSDAPVTVSKPVSAQPAGGSDSATVEEQEFGLRGKVRDEADMQFIEARIEMLQQDAHGIDYLQLDNGQVWREVNDARVRFKKGQKVRIVESIFDSYNLELEGVTRLIKVRRAR